jgi:hypothetical protein
VKVELIGMDSIKWEEGVWKAPKPSRGVLPQFCRYLLSRGYVPETPLEALRESRVVFKSPITVGGWANLSVVENDQGIKFVKYKPFENVKEIFK